MKAALRILFLACGCAAAALEEPPLPAWDADEREALVESGWIPGALLLTGELPEIPSADEGEANPAVDVAAPTAEELTDDAEQDNLVPEEFIGAYFAERPEHFLVDPQQFLDAKETKDRLGFLEYHSGDSTIDLFVYLFGTDEEIPGDVRAEETIERFYADGRPAAIVFYHLGAPQRSKLYLSPSLTDIVSAAEQRRALQSSVMQALEHVNHADQLAAFAVQMSIRIYWMERMLEGTQQPGEDGPLPAGRLPLPAVTKPRAVEREDTFSAWLDAVAARWTMPGAIFLGTAAGLAGLGAWWRTRARHRFPDLEVEPRLAGPHGAGIGAVISFASASVPPALQRDQVPDYLRRM